MQNSHGNIEELANIDVLLVQLSANPYFDMLSSYSVGQLGLYYLAEYAGKFGYNVKVKCYNAFDEVSKLLPELINSTLCGIVGFYVDSDNVWALKYLTPVLHDASPNVKIILGGPQVTGDPIGTLKLIPYITCGIIGEGEVTFINLLQKKVLDKESLMSIDGLVFYNIENVLHITKPQKQNKNIDEYSYPHREKYCLDLGRVNFSQLITGRGCMGRCAFCYEGSKEHSSLRVRSLESCLEEIDYLVETFKVKYLNIVDDTFILNRKRTELFCKRMIDKYHGTLKWYCEARADVLAKNIDMLPLLRQAGLVKIQLGGESGCQEILDAYNKGITIEEMEFVIEQAVLASIPYVYVNFIIGGAFETEHTFSRTLDFSKKIMNIAPGHIEVSSSVFTPTPGSPMYINPEKYGLRIIDKRNIRGANCSFVFAETEQLNQYKIWQLKNKFDNEINRTYTALLQKIDREQLKQIYQLYIHYGISTPWVEVIKRKTHYRNYLELLMRGNYYSFTEISQEDLMHCIPQRTADLNSDGTAYYRIIKSGEYVKNNDIENALITLSAGKLNLQDILSIIKSSPIFNRQYPDLISTCLAVYKNYDDNLAVVWKRI